MAVYVSDNLKKVATDALTALLGEDFGEVYPFVRKLTLVKDVNGSSHLPSALVASGPDPEGILVELEPASTADLFGAASSTGIATANAFNNGTVSAAGVAVSFVYENYWTNGVDEEWYRVAGTVGETADNPDIVINNKNLSVGQIVQLTSLTYRAVPQ